MIIEAGKQVIGILVDSVSEVVYLRQSEVESPPNVGSDAASFIHGVSNKNGELLILVDLSRMFSDEEWSEVEAI
ncbi:purine-binding chemotaxis protein [compost metagenome]